MIRYRLDDLGWFQFEWLCQSILKNLYGLTLESWGGHSDRGRDAFCSHALEFPTKDRQESGPFVFQAKFIENANAAGADPAPAIRSAVQKECKHIKDRNLKPDVGELKHYVLLTNSPVSATLRITLETAIKAELPQCNVSIQAANDICSILDGLPAIRVAFPQLLGIRDFQNLLQEVISKPILERSSLELKEAEEAARVFVPTGPYIKALEILRKNHFLVLTGPPEMGKTVIARIIGLAKLAEQWECIECTRPIDFLTTVKEHQRQVFIADDAFGTTEYNPNITFEWSADLPRVLRRLDNNHWFIWTSRPAPLKRALEKMHLQGPATNFPKAGECIVETGLLKEREKALILYRHAKAAGLSTKAKSALKQRVKTIYSHNHFTPLRISHLIRAYVKIDHQQDPETLCAEVDKLIRTVMEVPTESMQKSYSALDDPHRQLLISLLDVDNLSLDQISASFGRHGANDVQTAPETLVDHLAEHFIRGASE